MNELDIRADTQYSVRETAFIKAVFEAHQVEYWRFPDLGASIFDAIDRLRSSSGTQYDLAVAFVAIECLPLPAMAELAARFVRRLLPFAASAARLGLCDTKIGRALESGIGLAESYAAGKVTRATLERQEGDFFYAIHALPFGDENISKGAVLCFRGAYALGAILCLPESGGAVSEGRDTLRIALREAVAEEPHGLDLLRATAFDAKMLLDVDFFRSLIKLDPSPSFPLKRPLWPEGDPDWYQQEVKQMSTEAQPSPIPKTDENAKDELGRAKADSQEITISPIAFVRSMAAIFWSAIRYPFQTTEVDLSTGKVIRQY